jgi:hypothetical protein
MKQKKLIVFFLVFFLFPIATFAQWEELGGTLSVRLTHPSTRPEIHTLCTDDSGNVFAAGYFENSAGYYYVVKYNRKTKLWSELGDATTGGTPLNANNYITKIAADHIGNVYATGYFTNSFGNTYIAKWDNTTNAWAALDTLIPGENIVIDKANNVYTNAYDTTLKEDYIAKWDGAKWSMYGTTIGDVTTGLFTGGISKIVIDDLNRIYALKRTFIVVNDGTKWTDTINISSPYIAPYTPIFALAIDQDRNIYLGGRITDPSGLNTVNVLKLDIKSKVLDKLSHSIPPFTTTSGSPEVHTIVSVSSSEIYVGGYYLDYGTADLQVIKWSKTTDEWSIVGPSGGGIVGNINALVIDTIKKRNDLLAVGYLGNTAIGVMNNDQFIAEFKQYCSAYFTLAPSTLPHAYTITNYCFGAGTIGYKWNWGDGSPLDTGATPSHTYSSAGIYQICVEISDSLGCTSSYCIPKHSYLAKATGMVSVNVVKGLLPTSLMDEDQKNTDEINIYPNPTNDKIIVAGKGLEKEIQIKILDLLGKEVLSEKISLQNGAFQQDFDLKNVQSGLYILQLKSSKVSKSIKIYKN